MVLHSGPLLCTNNPSEQIFPTLEKSDKFPTVIPDSKNQLKVIFFKSIKNIRKTHILRHFLPMWFCMGKKFTLRIIFCSVLILLNQCVSEDQEMICNGHLKNFQSEVASVLNHFSETRSIASVEATPIELPQSERQEWDDWSHEKLISIQSFLDRSGEENLSPESKQLVHKIGNHLVFFRGASSRGKLALMQKNLKLVGQYIDELYQTHCFKQDELEQESGFSNQNEHHIEGRQL